jgi:hypothetical protein
MPASNNLAQATTLTTSGVHEFCWSIHELTGITTTGTNGADAIAEIGTGGTGTGAATKVCGTLAAITAGNASVGAMATDSPGYAWDPEAGYTETADQQASNVTLNVEFNATGEITPAFTETTSGATDWTMWGVALEIAAAAAVEPFIGVVRQRVGWATTPIITGRERHVRTMRRRWAMGAVLPLESGTTVLGTASESDSALTLTVGAAKTITYAETTDTALPFLVPQQASLGTAVETDSAGNFGRTGPITGLTNGGSRARRIRRR